MTHDTGSIQKLAQLLDMIQTHETARLARLMQKKAMLEMAGAELHQQSMYDASVFLTRLQAPAIEAWQHSVQEKIGHNAAELDSIDTHIQRQADVLSRAIGRADAIRKHLLNRQQK